MKKLFLILMGVSLLFFASCGEKEKAERLPAGTEINGTEKDVDAADKKEESKGTIVSSIKNGGEFKTNN